MSALLRFAYPIAPLGAMRKYRPVDSVRDDAGASQGAGQDHDNAILLWRVNRDAPSIDNSFAPNDWNIAQIDDSTVGAREAPVSYDHGDAMFWAEHGLSIHGVDHVGAMLNEWF